MTVKTVRPLAVILSGMSSQSCAHPSVGLQDHFTGTKQFVDSSHNSKRLYKSRKTEFSSGLCNSKVVVPVKMCKTLGFYSSLFLVLKLGKKWRLVIDVSVLNKHLLVPTFKMETAEVIRNAIGKEEWVVSIDLTDVYLHIPIHQKSKHLLRFHVAGQRYQFWGLLYGIAMATLEFTQVVKEVKQGNLDSSVSRRLVTSGSIKRNMHATVKTIGHFCARFWVGNKLPEIRAKIYSKFRFSGVQVHLGQWRNLTHRKEMEDLDKSHRPVAGQLDHKTQKSIDFHWDSGFSRKDSFSG